MKYILDEELFKDIAARLKSLKDENGNRRYSDSEISYYLLQLSRILSQKVEENEQQAK